MPAPRGVDDLLHAGQFRLPAENIPSTPGLCNQKRRVSGAPVFFNHADISPGDRFCDIDDLFDGATRPRAEIQGVGIAAIWMRNTLPTPPHNRISAHHASAAGTTIGTSGVMAAAIEVASMASRTKPAALRRVERRGVRALAGAGVDAFMVACLQAVQCLAQIENQILRIFQTH